MPNGELGLKFKAEKDCHITLYGAELGGPIYKVYDRQSGALLDTIVISPEIWTESGQQINDENFPDRTYHPNRYVVGDDQYSGLVIESRGASEEIQVRCGSAPAPPPPTTPPVPPTTPPPLRSASPTTTPTPDQESALLDWPPLSLDTITFATTTPAPMPYESAGRPTTTPSPGSVGQKEGCDCPKNILFLPDRAMYSTLGTYWFDLFPPLNIDPGWEVSDDDPRKAKGYNAKCWVIQHVGWPEGTRPEGTIGTETRMYCKWPTKGGLAKGGLEGFSEDPMGPWHCPETEGDDFFNDDMDERRAREEMIDNIIINWDDLNWVPWVKQEGLSISISDPVPGEDIARSSPEAIEAIQSWWDSMRTEEQELWKDYIRKEKEYRKDLETHNKQLNDALDSADKKKEGWEVKIEDWKGVSDDFGKKWNTNDPGFTPSADSWAPPNWGWSPEQGWHQGSPYIPIEPYRETDEEDDFYSEPEDDFGTEPEDDFGTDPGPIPAGGRSGDDLKKRQDEELERLLNEDTPSPTTTPQPLVQPPPTALKTGEWFWNNDNDNLLTPFQGIPQENMAFWMPVDWDPQDHPEDE